MADSEGAGAEVIIPVEDGAVDLVLDKAGDAPAAAATPAAEPVVAQVAAEPAQKIVTADEGIESLKEQVARAKAESQQRLNESQRKIQEAFETARRAEERAVHAEKDVITVKQGAVLTVLDSLKRDKDDARRKYAAAVDAGDHGKMAEAIDEISLANTRMVEAEKGKQELEERAKAPPVVAQRPEPLASDDPAERFAASIEKASPRSADWIRQHPEYARDQTKNDDMTAAHYAALGKRLKPESTAYFEFINQELGLTKAPVIAPANESPPIREASRAPASAPVSRDIAQSPNAARPGSIHLSAEEVRTALDTYTPLYPKATRQELLQKYATDKVALMNEGKIGRVAS